MDNDFSVSPAQCISTVSRSVEIIEYDSQYSDETGISGVLAGMFITGRKMRIIPPLYGAHSVIFA